MAEQIAQLLLLGASAPDRQTRMEAESRLRAAEKEAGFAQVLLQIVAQPASNDPTLSILAALHLKNFVKAAWQMGEDQDFVIGDADKAVLKQNLLPLLLTAQSRIQSQLAETLTIISSHEFSSNKWPELVPSLVAKLPKPAGTPQEPVSIEVISGVLHVAHSIFKSYRHKFKSDDLFREIKFVVGEFGPSFLLAFSQIVEALQASGSQNQQTVQVTFRAATLAAKVFHDLNYQDLPEFFEDKMETFMSGFHIMLTSSHPALQTADQDTPTQDVELHAAVVGCLILYLEKYDEEFQPFLGTLATDAWQLLSSCGPEAKYDILVIAAARFMTAVATGPSHKLFEGESQIGTICQNIVIPHILLREADFDMFEGDPEEFIRKDIEGSDMETRRRAAHDLVKGLLKYFEPQVTVILTNHIKGALTKQYADEQDLCRAKDSCMYLVTAITAKGTTAASGATATNQLVDLVDFFKSHVLTELVSGLEEREILKAAALKFTATFRGQLSATMSSDMMNASLRLLKSENEVVHSYAANLVNKLLAMKDASNKPMFTAQVVAPIASQLLSELFGVLERDGVVENEYVIKAVLRIFRILQDGMAPHVEICVTKLKAILEKVCENPKKPIFNHYLFECIACLLKYIVIKNPQTAQQFEQFLFPSFQNLLSKDVADFIPYVFQLMNLLIQVRPKPVPDVYMGLLPSFLNVQMYARPANVPPLAALLAAYMRHAGNAVATAGHLGGVLGVFQHLISKKAHDHDGLALLSSIFRHLDQQHFLPQLPTVVQLLLTRMQTQSTSKFERNLCFSFLTLCSVHGGSLLCDTLEKMQPGLAPQIIKFVIIKRLPELSRPETRRVAAVGAVKLLCETPAMVANDSLFQACWTPVLQSLINLLQAKSTSKAVDEEEEMATIEQTAVSGQAGQTFSKLFFAAVDDSEAFAALPASEQYLATQVVALSQANPGKLKMVITATCPEVLQPLSGYLASVGASDLA